LYKETLLCLERRGDVKKTSAYVFLAERTLATGVGLVVTVGAAGVDTAACDWADVCGSGSSTVTIGRGARGGVS